MAVKKCLFGFSVGFFLVLDSKLKPGVQADDTAVSSQLPLFLQRHTSNMFVLIFEVQENPFDKNHDFFLS